MRAKILLITPSRARFELPVCCCACLPCCVVIEAAPASADDPQEGGPQLPPEMALAEGDVERGAQWDRGGVPEAWPELGS